MSKVGSTWQKDAQACAGGWMELGTLTGAGAGSDKKDRAGVSEPAGYIDRC